jgi:transcriptional regulator
MYIPAAFRIEDAAWIAERIRANPFASLVTVYEGKPFATHLPFRFEPHLGEQGALQAHLARPNPQWKNWTVTGSANPDEEVLVIFEGPHAYISPTWYVQQPNVPTWNYEVVHVYGKPRLMHDTELLDFLATLSADYEGDGPNAWSFASLTEEYREKMMRGIVGVEIAVTRLEGKAKMSQNRSEADRNGVIAGLRAQGSPLSVATAESMAQRESD